MSIAQLGYEIDSSQAVEAERNLDRMGEAAGRAGNDAQGLEKQSSGLASTFKKLGPLAAGLAASLATMFSARAVIGAAEQYENRMARVNAVIEATGGVAGRTAEQLEANAQALARATLESVDGVMQAQQTLLTFRNVQGEVFDRAIESAADLSAAMGQDLTSSTRQLARALEDPIQGVTALTRSGTVFTQQQRDMIRTLVESGDLLGAQNLILEELEGQYSGVAQAGAGLREAKDSLSQSLTNLLISLNENLGINERLTSAYNMLAEGLQWLADNLELARGYIIAGALAITAYYLPALIAAAPAVYAWVAANTTLIASLITLRGALIASGIGAFIVLAGTALNFLFRLRQATGSWGEAFGILRNVASEAFDRIKDAASLMVVNVQIQFNEIQYKWTEIIGSMMLAWGRFVDYVAGSSVGQLLGLEGGAEAAAGGAVSSQLNDLTDELVSLKKKSSELEEGLQGPLKSWQAIKDILEETADETEVNTQRMVDSVNDLNNALAGGGGGGGSGAGGGGLLDMVEERRSAMQIMLDDTADFFGALAGITATGSEKVNRVIQVAGAIQAGLNTLVAQSQVLADPTLGFWGKLAAYAKIGVAGFNLAASLRRGGGSSGSGSGGATPTRAEGVTQQQTPLRRTIVELRGPDWVKGIIQPVMEQIYEASEDGQVVFAR